MSPLVSVIIPTHDRPELLLSRSLPSALNQTYHDLDIHVVGDGATQAVVDAMATVTDPRVRFTNCPRQHYQDDPYKAWLTSGSDAINHGLDTALGSWCCWLGDDDEFMPTYVERLLAAAEEQDVDAIYGRSEIIAPSGESRGFLGSWPPALGSQTNDLLWRRNDVRIDPECWTRGLPNDWLFWQDLMAAGLRFGFIPEVLLKYWPSNYIPGCGAV
jgi:glycosyltransferase involved in cell wall biosynthesis